MKIMLKLSLLITVIAFASPMNSSAATRGAGQCFREYQACIAAGHDLMECENGYWYCRYGYIPVKSSILPSPIDRRD